MPLLIDLPSEVESTILAEAERRGLLPSDYLRELVLDSRARLPLLHVLHELMSLVRQLELLGSHADSRDEVRPDNLAGELNLLSHRIANIVGAVTSQRHIHLWVTSFDIFELVHKTVTLFSFRAERRGVAFQLEVPESPLFLRSDRSEVARLLTIVLDNAVKYSAPGGALRHGSVVRVGVRRRDIAGSIEVNVTSCGVGILPDELESGAIFEYGRRGLLAEKVVPGGTGIGLAEARRIATALGAGIKVDSRPLDGQMHYMTSVKLILPPVSDNL